MAKPALTDEEVWERVTKKGWSTEWKEALMDLRAFYRKLKDDMGGDQDSVAKAAGYDRSTLSAYLVGRSAIGRAVVEALAGVDGTPPADAVSNYAKLPGNGRSVDTRRISMSIARTVDDLAAIKSGLPLPETDKYDVFDGIPIDGLFAFVMPDSSMSGEEETSIASGTVCLSSTILKPKLGCLVVVTADGAATVREWRKTSVVSYGSPRHKTASFTVHGVMFGVGPRSYYSS